MPITDNIGILSKAAKLQRRDICDILALELYNVRKNIKATDKETRRKQMYGVNKKFMLDKQNIYTWLKRDALENAL